MAGRRAPRKKNNENAPKGALFMVYLFDMDGTLIDSMPTFSGAIIKFLDEVGASYPEDVIKTVTPLGFAGTVKYFREKLKLELTDEFIMKSLGENMLAGYLYTIPSKPFVKEKLTELKAAGHTLAVLTASPHLTLDPCLARLGLDKLFDAIWSSDDFGKSKSDPSIYLDALDRLGVAPSECIFVDDNVGAVKAAKAAGLHSYGIYDPSSEEYKEEMRKEAEKYIMDFSEL